MKRHLLCLLTIFTVLFFAYSSVFGAIVGLRSHDDQLAEVFVMPDDIFLVDLYLELSPSESVLIQNDGIAGFSIGLTWDNKVALQQVDQLFPSINLQDVNFNNYPIGTPITPEWQGQDGDQLFLGSLVEGLPLTSSVTIATLTLKSTNPGDAFIDLFPGLEGFGIDSWSLLSTESLENALASSGGITYAGITIHSSASTVPLPSAFILLAGGLMGMIGVRRRKEA